jgi:hypothetical protein
MYPLTERSDLQRSAAVATPSFDAEFIPGREDLREFFDLTFRRVR